MKRTLAFMIMLVLLLTVCAAPAFADGVTLNALFMKQAGYSEDDVTAMTQAFTEATGIKVNPTFVEDALFTAAIVLAAIVGMQSLCLESHSVDSDFFFS